MASRFTLISLETQEGHMAVMEHTESIVIDAPVEDVWELAAHRFHEIDHWASEFNSSEGLPDDPAIASGGQPAGRICHTNRFGDTEHHITHFDADAHTFTYRGVAERVPGFVQDATTTWKIDRLSDSQTRLVQSGAVTTSGIMGMLAQLPFRALARRIYGHNLEEFKYYVETGEPHPRKVRHTHN